MFEVLIVISIISILAAISMPAYSNMVGKVVPKKEVSEIESFFKKARVKSMSGKSDSFFGVYFDSSEKLFHFYKGSSYLNRDLDYYADKNIVFSGEILSPNDDFDINFSGAYPNISDSIDLHFKKANFEKMFSINKFGAIN